MQRASMCKPAHAHGCAGRHTHPCMPSSSNDCVAAATAVHLTRAPSVVQMPTKRSSGDTASARKQATAWLLGDHQGWMQRWPAALPGSSVRLSRAACSSSMSATVPADVPVRQAPGQCRRSQRAVDRLLQALGCLCLWALRAARAQRATGCRAGVLRSAEARAPRGRSSAAACSDPAAPRAQALAGQALPVRAVLWRLPCPPTGAPRASRLG